MPPSFAAAIELRCATLYTEDLNHGQTYESVQVINPFVWYPISAVTAKKPRGGA